MTRMDYYLATLILITSAWLSVVFAYDHATGQITGILMFLIALWATLACILSIGGIMIFTNTLLLPMILYRAAMSALGHKAPDDDCPDLLQALFFLGWIPPAIYFFD